MVFVLLVRDTQGPIDNVRSRALNIQELRHIGDTYVLRRSKEEAASAPNLTFPPLVDVPKFEVADMTSRFEALTVCGGESCAIVRFESAPCRFETVFAENLMLGGSMFRGTLTLRLSDGSHQHAECLEYVMFEGGGKNSPHYEMWRIAEKDYVTK